MAGLLTCAVFFHQDIQASSLFNFIRTKIVKFKSNAEIIFKVFKVSSILDHIEVVLTKCKEIVRASNKDSNIYHCTKYFAAKFKENARMTYLKSNIFYYFKMIVSKVKEGVIIVLDKMNSIVLRYLDHFFLQILLTGLE